MGRFGVFLSLLLTIDTGGAAYARSHCGHGLFYRPHLGRCVGLHSALARDYTQRVRRPESPRERGWFVNAMVPVKPEPKPEPPVTEPADGATPRDFVIPYRLDGSRMFNPAFTGWRL